MSAARRLIDRLGLQPHVEGGWYKETWRAPAEPGGRPSSTAILFLLERGQRSHWHRVDADEIWLWQGGDALRLSVAQDDWSAPRDQILAGSDRPDSVLQSVVPKGWWQAAEPEPNGRLGYVLVGCIVAPGFEFAGFELAEPGWSPGGMNA